jgi:AraC family transcriptional regulator of adaptative response/methylated-DNA-[protein]-cysteine methyltransferase
MEPTIDTFLSSRDFARMARAIRYIDGHFQEQPRLASVAGHVGLSEFHFNRLFRRWAGLTPKQFLARVTGTAARLALGADLSVLDAAHAVGLSGPGRLHDLVVTLDAVTPGELKAAGEGVEIRYGFSPTPFGTALFAETARGLSHLSFVEDGEEDIAVNALQASWKRARFERDDDRAIELAETIWGTKRPQRAELRLAVRGTNFQLKVWEALLTLGARRTVTYSELARAVGMPGGARAVGNAVGANPVGYLIPCHHVLLRSRALGDYHWGMDRKRAMLAWESFGDAQHLAQPASARMASSRNA